MHRPGYKRHPEAAGDLLLVIRKRPGKGAPARGGARLGLPRVDRDEVRGCDPGVAQLWMPRSHPFEQPLINLGLSAQTTLD